MERITRRGAIAGSIAAALGSLCFWRSKAGGSSTKIPYKYLKEAKTIKCKFRQRGHFLPIPGHVPNGAYWDRMPLKARQQMACNMALELKSLGHDPVVPYTFHRLNIWNIEFCRMVTDEYVTMGPALIRRSPLLTSHVVNVDPAGINYPKVELRFSVTTRAYSVEPNPSIDKRAEFEKQIHEMITGRRLTGMAHIVSDSDSVLYTIFGETTFTYSRITPDEGEGGSFCLDDPRDVATALEVLADYKLLHPDNLALQKYVDMFEKFIRDRLYAAAEGVSPGLEPPPVDNTMYYFADPKFIRGGAV